jgi:hypothetical protein
VEALFLVGLAFWQFIPVYSSIVLAPAWVLEAADGGSVEAVVSGPTRIEAGLRPFARLAAYTVYLLAALVVVGFLNRG